MAGLINELITVLREQAVNYDELLALSVEKTKVIVENDLETLQKITAAENSIVGKNQKLDRKREDLVKDIANVLNTKADELTLTTLADLIKNQEEYTDLLSVRDELKKTLTELKTVNDNNKMLIEGSLDYIEFSMNVIRSTLSPQTSYLSNDEGDGDKGFFDAKQ